MAVLKMIFLSFVVCVPLLVRTLMKDVREVGDPRSYLLPAIPYSGKESVKIFLVHIYKYLNEFHFQLSR